MVWKQTNILGFQKQVLKKCFQNINQKLLLFLPENKGVILLVQILLVAILQDPSIKYLVQECVLMNNSCYCWSIYHVYQYIMLMINISCVIVDQYIMYVAWVLEPSLYLPCLTSTNCPKHHKQTHVKSLVPAQFLNLMSHKFQMKGDLVTHSISLGWDLEWFGWGEHGEHQAFSNNTTCCSLQLIRYNLFYFIEFVVSR